MDKIPVKYNTTCSDKKSGSVLIEKIFEAASKDEAETRAFLHCVKSGNGLDAVDIDAEKI